MQARLAASRMIFVATNRRALFNYVNCSSKENEKRNVHDDYNGDVKMNE